MSGKDSRGDAKTYYFNIAENLSVHERYLPHTGSRFCVPVREMVPKYLYISS